MHGLGVMVSSGLQSKSSSGLRTTASGDRPYFLHWDAISSGRTMQQALTANSGLDGHDAFLRAMRFWDVSDPDIVCMAQSLRRSSGDRETAVAMFG